MAGGKYALAAFIADASIDGTAEVELQRDLDVSERARRGHLGQTRDLAELGLERRCHRGRHRLRVGAGQLRRDLKRGEVHVRQRCHGKQRIGHKPAEKQPNHQ
jgi:hypothetical protein